MNILDKPIMQFLLGGIIISGGTYLANFAHPLIAILLVSFPLELITLYLIENRKRQRNFILSWIIFLIGNLIAAILLYLIIPLEIISYNLKLIICFLVMCASLIISYFHIKF